MKVLKKVFVLNKGQAGYAVAPVVEAPEATSWQVAGSISNGSGVVSASNINEYLVHLPCGKGGRCVGLTTLKI